MPKPKADPVPAPPAESPSYPAIEAFIERATPDDVAQLFEPIKVGLGGLKGSRAEQAKKVGKALARTEELLALLLQVREKLEAEQQAQGKGRK